MPSFNHGNDILSCINGIWAKSAHFLALFHHLFKQFPMWYEFFNFKAEDFVSCWAFLSLFFGWKVMLGYACAQYHSSVFSLDWLPWTICSTIIDKHMINVIVLHSLKCTSLLIVVTFLSMRTDAVNICYFSDICVCDTCDGNTNLICSFPLLTILLQSLQILLAGLLIIQTDWLHCIHCVCNICCLSNICVCGASYGNTYWYCRFLSITIVFWNPQILWLGLFIIQAYLLHCIHCWFSGHNVFLFWQFCSKY